MRSIAIAAISAAALTLTACAPIDDSADPNIATPAAGGSATTKAKAKAKPKTTRTITYRIGGSATKALITYTTPSGQEQQNGANVPWHRSFKVKKDSFNLLTVSAQNSGGGTYSRYDGSNDWQI